MDDNEIQATPSRWRRRRRIALAGIALLTAALTVNAVSVSADTETASGEQIMRLPDGDMHVVESGPANAPAVVLLHGLGGSTAWWDPIMPALRDSHVVRVDLLGHGASAKPADGYAISAQANRVGAILDQLGIRHAVIIGHSSGGYAATALAEQRRDLVTALTLIDTGPSMAAEIGEGPTGRLLFTPGIGELAWQLRTDGIIREALSSAFTRDVQVPAQIVADVRGMTYRSFTGAAAASENYLTARAIPDRLADLGVPTLVIYGSQDKRWQPTSFEDYRRVPRVRVVMLEVGHTPMFEDPDATGALLRDFIAAPAVG
ncbi:alpha/beta fold hydrolase [Nocardia sp. SYP-A9097]|uniref:alpha/beta fold hydrolase n=1 Tax=Nocardia sp. SYP-A9097 TaxID=2663237 RepID=UPI00129A36E8|nr:alpha/beta hydrolase [Nocardia sp. SYP-A9097]MRH86869.1 alpha/beta fold hydrolase [Nocardia sp. SYP-A9097]